MERLSMEERKKMFLDIAHLITVMEDYERMPNRANQNKLDNLIMAKEIVLLPSGKWGNVLAFALEMHKFIAANYILENKEKFNISLDYVAFEIGNCGLPIHYENELDFALSYFDSEKEEMIEYSELLLLESSDISKEKIELTLDAIEKLKNFKRFKR